MVRFRIWVSCIRIAHSHPRPWCVGSSGKPPALGGWSVLFVTYTAVTSTCSSSGDQAVNPPSEIYTAIHRSPGYCCRNMSPVELTTYWTRWLKHSMCEVEGNKENKQWFINCVRLDGWLCLIGWLIVSDCMVDCVWLDGWLCLIGSLIVSDWIVDCVWLA